MRVLRAAKAAGFMSGEKGYWDLFDALQNGLFVESRNIDDDEVIYDIVKKTISDFDTWKELYVSDDVNEAVLFDLSQAHAYGIRSVPSLVIDGKYLINGALPLERLEINLRRLLDEKRKQWKDKPTLITPDGEEGDPSCDIKDGKWKCN